MVKLYRTPSKEEAPEKIYKEQDDREFRIEEEKRKNEALQELMTPRRRTLTDIVDLLVDRAFQILEWKYEAAITVGNWNHDKDRLPADWPSYDHSTLNELVDIIKPMLRSVQETRKLEAQTSKDVTAMLSKGKISMQEGMKLLALMKTQKDVEEKEMSLDVQRKLLEIL